MTSPLRERKTFSSFKQATLEPPNFLQAQLDSYRWFCEKGLSELLEEISPIVDQADHLELHFLDYYLDAPKHTEETARDRNATYEAPIRCAVRLVNKKTGEVKEQEVYLGEFPVMTGRGTFVINGVERVVVSQLIRSPGVFFSSQFTKGRSWYGAKIIPNRGAWLELETGVDGAVYVRIDRKRKVPVTSLLRALEIATADQDMKEMFANVEKDPEVNFIETTLEKDVTHSAAEGLREVYKRLRPGDLATVDNARQMIQDMFFRLDRYDFGKVGRYRLNQRLNMQVSLDQQYRTLRHDDLTAVLREVIRLNVSQERADDIDHLGNRRVRAVGELIQNKFRVGLTRMDRIAKDRMSTVDIEKVTPAQLVNARPIIAAIKEFFASSQLSQFMDQTNPLSEVEHKRRMSAMGPGGLDRHRAGFEVRDVHSSHYGRICPIQTPEGPNIGLVNHMSIYARLNEFGFLETAYRRVVSGRITDDIEYLDAYQEEKHVIAQAGEPLDEQGRFLNKKVEARKQGQFSEVSADEVDFADVSPQQIVSIASGLIPFIEHDDAQRALMGSNMQRQAVASVVPQAPRVGTGLEARAALDSGQTVTSDTDGEVKEVDAAHITVQGKEEKRVYRLQNFQRSNHSTSMTQHPLVEKGQQVKASQLLADGSATDQGELALGQNLVVAFIPWYGGNFEDAIVVSEQVVRDDRYTSGHVEDFLIDVRDTKLGPEVVTRDIPNVGEEKLRNLAEDGIVRLGAEVHSGDILVGKVTNKGETDLTSEERLLRAIFGEKAKDVKDTSLYLAHGEMGKVVDIKTFSREEGDKLPSGVLQQVQVSVAQLRKLQVGDKLAGRHGNKGVISEIRAVEDMPFLADGTPVDIVLNPMGVASRMNLGQILETHLGIAAQKLEFFTASPPFVGVEEEEIQEQLAAAGLPRDGQVRLFDGVSGEAFDHPVTVGVMYVMKLHHLVEDKIHMRSTGPYSLVTQQPLGGKAQFGGQRFGEMEVWALEAYGAAHSLQEMLTIKSDDVPGRSKTYESIVRGSPIQPPRVPAAFDVLVKELKGLALDVELTGQQEVKPELEEEEDAAQVKMTAREASEEKERRLRIR